MTAPSFIETKAEARAKPKIIGQTWSHTWAGEKITSTTPAIQATLKISPLDQALPKRPVSDGPKTQESCWCSSPGRIFILAGQKRDYLLPARIAASEGLTDPAPRHLERGH